MVKSNTLYCPECGKETIHSSTDDGKRCDECLTIRRLDKYSRATRIVLFLKEHYSFNSAQIRHILTNKLDMKDPRDYNKINNYVKRFEIEDANRNWRYRRIKKEMEKRGLI